MNVPEIATRLSSFFDEERKFAVVGGFALLAHGIQRATFDLDILVEATEKDQLIAFLEQLGFESLSITSGFSNHLHPESDLGRLGVVYLDDQTAKKIFASGAEREILTGVWALVPKPEHLAAMKVRAIKNDPTRRLQDLADIQQLSQLPGVDRNEIRDYFEALDLGNLLKNSTKNSRSSNSTKDRIDLLEGLPRASASESEVLRRARGQALDAQRIGRILAAMPQPSHQDLANRPVSFGEPFRL